MKKYVTLLCLLKGISARILINFLRELMRILNKVCDDSLSLQHTIIFIDWLLLNIVLSAENLKFCLKTVKF